MQRLRSLDGFRGILALVVLAYHVRLAFGTDSPVQGQLATWAVWCFFVMSGLVLTRGYDGRWLVFMARRWVRLWPVYVVCVTTGALVLHRLPPITTFLCFAGWDVHAGVQALLVNPPAWSLCVEMLAMPFMPAIAWFGRGPLWRTGLVPLLWLFASEIATPWQWLGFFALGAALSRFDFTVGVLETAVPQWLGKISYSLYLVHVPMIYALLTVGGQAAVLLGLPLIFGVAFVVWRYIEMPSVACSRRIGRPVQRAAFDAPAILAAD